MSVLFVQPWDKPWTSPRFVSRRSEMYMSRSQFEVGWQVPDENDLRFLDLNLSLKEKLSVKEAIVREVGIANPKLVLVSWPTYVLGNQIGLIIDAIASECPSARIVLGGAAISLVRDRPLRDWPAVSACYSGNGFEIPELIRSLMKSENCDGISGVYSRCTSNGCTTVADPVLIDSYLPEEFYTARGRLNFQEYVSRCRLAGVKPLGIIEMSRGCRFRCDYCAINFNRIGFQLRSPKVVVQEARFLASNGITEQQLIDPTLGLDREATAELLDGLAEVAQEFPAFSLEVLTRPEFVQDEFVGLLRRASVKRCALGMETMDQNELRQVQKTLRVSLTRQAIYKLAESGITVKLFHVLFPRRFSWATIRFFAELNRQGVKFVVQSSFLRPLANPRSRTDYLSHDQTVFVPALDSHQQLMEWMLVNLAFPSMDVGPDGSPELREVVEGARCAEDLQGRFQVTKGGRESWLSMNGNKYGYVHPARPQAVADCLFME